MMMRKFWPLLMAGSVGAMSVQAAPADTYELLVGSYTAGSSEGIYRLQFDSRTGKFQGQPVLAAEAANPSWLTISKDQKHLLVLIKILKVLEKIQVINLLDHFLRIIQKAQTLLKAITVPL